MKMLKLLTIIGLSTLMLTACGRKNTLAPVPNTETVAPDTTEDEPVEDRRFVLDVLL